MRKNRKISITYLYQLIIEYQLVYYLQKYILTLLLAFGISWNI